MDNRARKLSDLRLQGDVFAANGDAEYEAGRGGRFAWIPKDELVVDDRYQRNQVRKSRVNYIANNWSWEACGVLYVSPRHDGTYAVWDGNHRLTAAMKLDWIKQLPCMVFATHSVRDEAKLFLEINDQRGPVKSMDKWNAKLFYGDETAHEIAKVVESLGWRVAGGGLDRTIQCVGALERYWKQLDGVAEQALRLCIDLAEAQGAGHRYIRGPMFVGMVTLAAWMQNNPDKCNSQSLFDKKNRDALLAKGASEIQRMASLSAELEGRGGPLVYAKGIARLLNDRRRTNRIEIA